MELNKKIYKYISIISFTVVIMFIANLLVPIFTEAENNNNCVLQLEEQEDCLNLKGIIPAEYEYYDLYWAKGNMPIEKPGDKSTDQEKIQYAENVIKWFDNNKIKEKETIKNQVEINSSITYKKGESYSVLCVAYVSEDEYMIKWNSITTAAPVEIENNISLKLSLDGKKIKVEVSDPKYEIKSIKYDKSDEVIKCEEFSNRGQNVEFNEKNNITTYINLDNAGTYYVYAENSAGAKRVEGIVVKSEIFEEPKQEEKKQEENKEKQPEPKQEEKKQEEKKEEQPEQNQEDNKEEQLEQKTEGKKEEIIENLIEESSKNKLGSKITTINNKIDEIISNKVEDYSEYEDLDEENNNESESSVEDNKENKTENESKQENNAKQNIENKEQNEVKKEDENKVEKEEPKQENNKSEETEDKKQDNKVAEEEKKKENNKTEQVQDKKENNKVEEVKDNKKESNESNKSAEHTSGEVNLKESNKKLPQTGSSNVSVNAIIIFSLIGIVSFIQYKRIKE